MARYDHDYSVTEIKKMIAISEAHQHPYNPGNVGHAFRDHHGISDADVIAKGKSAFIISQETNFKGDTLDPAMIGLVKVYTRTIYDQPFMVAGILNTNFGQAALKLLNVAMGARMTIHAKPVSTPGGAMRIRVKTGGGTVDATGLVKHVVLVLDNGGRDHGKDYLHFVTAYPTDSATYKFKFGPQVPRTRPGVEFYTENGRKSLYVWGSDNQTDDSQLNLILMA